VKNFNNNLLIKIKKSALCSASVGLLFLLTACNSNKEVSSHFSTDPEKPVAGEEFTVSFDASGTKVANSDELTMLVFEHTNNEPIAGEVKMKKDGSNWKASFKSQPGTRSLVVAFKSGDNLENNEKKGFRIQLYEKNGDPVKGADAAYVDFMRNYGSVADFSVKNKELFKLINSEFVVNPQFKVQYYPVYISLLRRMKPDISDSLIKADLDQFAAVKEPDEMHLVALTAGYRMLKDNETAEKYMQTLSEKFPKNPLVAEENFMTLWQEENLQKQKDLLLQFVKDFPNYKYIDMAADKYLGAFAKDKDWTAVEKEISELGVVPSAVFYNKTAQKYLSGKEQKSELALQIINTGIEKAEKEKKEMNYKWLSTPASLYLEELNNNLSMLNYTKGLAQKSLGDYAEALASFKTSAELSKMKDVSVLPEYFAALDLVGKTEEALELAKKSKAEGVSNKVIDSLIAKFYTQTKGDNKGLDELMAELNKKAENVISEKLKKEYLDIPANDFTLTDLGGQQVTLSKLRGKVVILDFWATWCGPCIASFPTMKKATEKYADDPKVVFLFVNAWETAKDKKQNAQNFMTSKGYNFHVLLDENDKVITDYEVSGIPTKFIIDGGGKIRFESIGFDDNEEEMLKEIDLMIKMAK